jgi:hypothetical protein
MPSNDSPGGASNMPEVLASPSPDVDQEHGAARADIDITAQGDRRSLEVLYLELRELAKRNGLEIEYRLTQTKPADQS